MDTDNVNTILRQLGMGLSRLLRYIYPGVLLVIIYLSRRVDCVTNTLPYLNWHVILIALIMGAALYAIHRGIFIPIHHLLLCLIFRIFDGWWRKPEDSTSPTHWLRYKGVKNFHLILTYNKLRQSNLWTDSEREELNIAHAENGLVVMTSEALILTSLMSYKYPCFSEMITDNNAFLLKMGIFTLIASFPRAWFQHSMECLRMKEKATDVEKKLGDWGLLTKGT